MSEEILNTLARLDWSSFHECGHPVQRWDGRPLPCAEHYRGGPRFVLTLPPSYATYEALASMKREQVSALRPPLFDQVLFDRVPFRVLPGKALPGSEEWTDEVSGYLWRALKTVDPK